jgi:hypothetical protein
VNDDLRRALRNGAIAAAVTAIIGFSLDAALSGGASKPEATGTRITPAPPMCGPAWETVPSADPDPTGNQLLGVSAAAPGEVWAVGARGPAEAPATTLIERWDGERWQVVASPNVGTVANVLRAVDARSPDDAWAVGSASSGREDQPLILHWNGSSWTVSTVPIVTGGASLAGVAAIAPDDVWAVGYTGDATLGLERAFALHWDGASWVTSSINAGSGRSLLSSMSATSSSDVWAVGYLHHRPLAVHFNGRAWRGAVIESPGTLSAVASSSPDHVWAVGSSIWFWDGSDWTETGEIRGGGHLQGIAAASDRDVWAVGSRPAGGGTRALAQRFGGRNQTVVRGQGVPGSDAFTAATALPSGAVWAVGYYDTARGRLTLVARRFRSCEGR